jgi:FSR family fosmidomycin resistance protein-like MFS transporter
MLADWTSLAFVYHVCAFLPAVGLLGGFLPSAPGRSAAAAKTA